MLLVKIELDYAYSDSVPAVFELNHPHTDLHIWFALEAAAIAVLLCLLRLHIIGTFHITDDH